MENKNILSFTEMAVNGLAGIISEIKKMPDVADIPESEKEKMREALRNSDLDKSEAQIKEAIIKLANIAK